MDPKPYAVLIFFSVSIRMVRQIIATIPAGWEFPEMVVKSGNLPKRPGHSGLGIILICPDTHGPELWEERVM